MRVPCESDQIGGLTVVSIPVTESDFDSQLKLIFPASPHCFWPDYNTVLISRTFWLCAQHKAS